MATNSTDSDKLLLGCVVTAEFHDVPSLGLGKKFFASGNVGFYEKSLLIIRSADAGIPVCAESKNCEATKNLEIRSNGHSKKLPKELGAYRDRHVVQALVMNSAQSNVAIGTV